MAPNSRDSVIMYQLFKQRSRLIFYSIIDQNMHFESRIFQLKRGLKDTSLVTFCYAIDEKFPI